MNNELFIVPILKLQYAENLEHSKNKDRVISKASLWLRLDYKLSRANFYKCERELAIRKVY